MRSLVALTAASALACGERPSTPPPADAGPTDDASVDAPALPAECPPQLPSNGAPCDPQAIAVCFYGEDTCCDRTFSTATCFCDPGGTFNCTPERICGDCLDPATCERVETTFDCYAQATSDACLAGGGGQCTWQPPGPSAPSGHCHWTTCGDLSRDACLAGDHCLWVTQLEACYPRTEAPLACGPVEG